MTFAQLPVGAVFTFVEDIELCGEWNWHTKTDARTFKSRVWKDGSGGKEGRVGVGDNPVQEIES